MTILLYDKHSSSCCRAVKLTLEALNLDYKSHILDVANREHFSEYYLKMNPQHTFPVLDDNGTILIDSHAINIYLVSKYGKDDSLYPSCYKKRAIVNHRLFYEATVLFPCEKRLFTAAAKEGVKIPDRKEAETVREAYDVLEKILKNSGTKYIADDNITVADLSVIPTLGNLAVLIPGLTEENHPHLVAYMKRCEQNIKGYDRINRSGHEAVVKILKEGYYHK